MNKIIALQAPANCGKSSTLKFLFGQLLLEGFDPIPGSFRIHGDDPTKDFMGVLVFNQIKIGIQTKGDVLKDMLDELEHFRPYKCDVLICALRPWKSKKLEHNYDTVIVPKTLADLSDPNTSVQMLYQANVRDVAAIRILLQAEIDRLHL